MAVTNANEPAPLSFVILSLVAAFPVGVANVLVIRFPLAL